MCVCTFLCEKYKENSLLPPSFFHLNKLMSLLYPQGVYWPLTLSHGEVRCRAKGRELNIKLSTLPYVCSEKLLGKKRYIYIVERWLLNCLIDRSSMWFPHRDSERQKHNETHIETDRNRELGKLEQISFGSDYHLCLSQMWLLIHNRFVEDEINYTCDDLVFDCQTIILESCTSRQTMGAASPTCRDSLNCSRFIWLDCGWETK